MQIPHFNKLPTFFQALENPEFTDEALMLAGDILVSLKLEDKYGVFLLHRHFDLLENEVLAKLRDDELLVSSPVDKNIPDLEPSSWCVAIGNSQGVDVYEYSIGVPKIDSADVKSVLRKFSEEDLGRIFGVYLRESIPDFDRTLFEVSDDNLRISLVSPWQDETHEDGWYRQSTFTFCQSGEGSGARLTNAGIACRNTTDCYGCAPSSPMIRQAVANLSSGVHEKGSFDASKPNCLTSFLASVRSLHNSVALSQ